VVSQRQPTWHLRGPKTPEIVRFVQFAKDNGWTLYGGHPIPFGSDRVLRRGDQKLVAEFFKQSFNTAWLYASYRHRGVQISDIEVVASFIYEPQEWAIEHAGEWQSEHEGAVIDRMLGIDREKEGQQ
jgi:hypothetical protein